MRDSASDFPQFLIPHSSILSRMSLESVLAGLVAVVLLIYLTYSLLRPEKF